MTPSFAAEAPEVHLSALFLLNLTDRILDYVEFTISKGYRVRKGNIGPNAICHIESSVELFNLGNVGAQTMFGNEIICYSREKMIVKMI